jgi:hypothetical protein
VWGRKRAVASAPHGLAAAMAWLGRRSAIGKDEEASSICRTQNHHRNKDPMHDFQIRTNCRILHAKEDSCILLVSMTNQTFLLWKSQRISPVLHNPSSWSSASDSQNSDQISTSQAPRTKTLGPNTPKGSIPCQLPYTTRTHLPNSACRIGHWTLFGSHTEKHAP